MDSYSPSPFRLGFLLSLVSSLQMFQQSLLASLTDAGLSSTQLAFASATFPLGKVVSTLWLLLCTSSPDVVFNLKVAARLLMFGGLVAGLPVLPALSIGRLLMGAGTGIGFVCAPLYLTELIPYSSRPAHFFVLGVAFAGSTLMANALALAHFTERSLTLFSSGFAFISGLIYLLLAPEQHPFASTLPVQPTDPTRISGRPVALSNALMLLNVTCGVPVLLGFAPIIFEEFGLSPDHSFKLSLLFPTAQVFLLSLLHFHPGLLSRKTLILGGYGVAVFVLFAITTTAKYPFLPDAQKSVALAGWLFVLTLVTSVPCNTALCVIAEQFPSGTEEQMSVASLSRTLMWLFSAISTSTFVPMIRSYGLTVTFLPYAMSSLLLLGLIMMWMPIIVDDEPEPAQCV
uniref:Membrane transporter n=1 Tax=Pristionchus pacificus TaxID=54126 RepID=A0A8R1Y4J1_PRIPA